MADVKVSAMTELTGVATSDLLYVVDDPGGSPLSRKATVTNVVAAGLTARPIQSVMTREGTLTATAGTLRLYNHAGVTFTIASVYADVNTAPTGASIIVDVHKDGTTIFTTQDNRPTIAASGNSSGAETPDVTSWADGSYLTLDVDQIGSTVAGADLTVTVKYSY